MFDLLMDPNVWAALVTLTALEVILGIDNIVFIAILSQRLDERRARHARAVGLSLAFIFRVILLTSLSWIMGLTAPVFTVFDVNFSWRDIILLGGGLFLLAKATHEIHSEVEVGSYEPSEGAGQASFWAIVGQLAVIDLVFSVDSIVTAVGLADHLEVMIAAVVIAMLVMFVAAGPVGAFIAKHPTTKMLALAFLLLIGVSLVADGMGFHIEKGYIYAAMGFSVGVEVLNMIKRNRRAKLTAETPAS